MKRQKEAVLTKELRLLGYDHEAAANKINIPASSISEWANGESSPGPIDTMKLRELGISKKARGNPSELV